MENPKSLESRNSIVKKVFYILASIGVTLFATNEAFDLEDRLLGNEKDKTPTEQRDATKDAVEKVTLSKILRDQLYGDDEALDKYTKILEEKGMSADEINTELEKLLEGDIITEKQQIVHTRLLAVERKHARGVLNNLVEKYTQREEDGKKVTVKNAEFLQEQTGNFVILIGRGNLTITDKENLEYLQKKIEEGKAVVGSDS